MDRRKWYIGNYKYRIVLVPRYRYKVLEKEVKEAVRDELKKRCIWLHVPIIEPIAKDHAHLYVVIL